MVGSAETIFHRIFAATRKDTSNTGFTTEYIYRTGTVIIGNPSVRGICTLPVVANINRAITIIVASCAVRTNSGVANICRAVISVVAIRHGAVDA